MRELDAADLDLRGIVRAGDHIVWGQATGEPQTLTETLVRQRRELGGVNVFVASCFSKTLLPEHTDYIRIASFGAMGTTTAIAAIGALEIVPCHVGQIARYIYERRIPCDVAFVQVSPPGPNGRFSFGVVHDFTPAAAAAARTVVAEVNDQVPWTYGAHSLAAEDIDFLVRTSRPVLEVKSTVVGEKERAIARHAGDYIGDGTVFQVGVGGIPDAILQSIGDRKDLGVHSGMVGDAFVDLVESGALTNARKEIDPGISIAGVLIGTRRLYEFAHCNRSLMMHDSAYTHAEAILEKLSNFVSVNSAVEVDLTGQVNSEVAGGSYIGATGGQVDFVRAGQRSPGGRSIIAFPSTARGDEISRISVRLSGPVSTARCETDLIITEHGAADLRAQPLRERMRRLIAVAHPKFRESLEREAHDLIRRGY